MKHNKVKHVTKVTYEYVKYVKIAQSEKVPFFIQKSKCSGSVVFNRESPVSVVFHARKPLIELALMVDVPRSCSAQCWSESLAPLSELVGVKIWNPKLH